MARLAASLADRYRIERELGAGGMATVYLAEDVRHHRHVAIKVLHAELSAILGPERFLKEIELTANLQHPHILPLFDSGSADGLLFYVMPFVDGETLRGRLDREQQLPIADAVRIAIEVAGALEYAHRHGIVHRDIKPENVLLHDGTALVTDFGIALAVEGAGGARMTQTGLSLGTPQYMSPEQAMGERNVDARSDIYSLGAITYEMLSGDAPFTGSTAQAIVAQIITAEPRSLIARRKSIPANVEDAVLTALQKLPADRFANAAEFSRALSGELPIRHTTAARVPHARGVWYRDWRTWAAAAVALSTAAFLTGRRIAQPHTPIAGFGHSGKVTWDHGLEIEPELSPDGQYVAYAAGTMAEMRINVRQVAGGRPIALTDDSLGAQTDPRWSPDGTRILFLAGGGVFSAPSSGGPARPEMGPAHGSIISAAWAPDGRTIAYVVADSLYIRDPAGRVRSLARISEAALCRWSPTGDLIACASGNAFYSRVSNFFGNLSPSRVVVARVSDGATSTVTDSVSVNQSPVWSPDGRWLYYLSSRAGPRDILAVRISRDGRADGAPVRLTTGLGAHSISTSADGRRLAYDTYTATSNLRSLPFPPNGATASATTPVTSGVQIIEDAEATADGKWIFYDSDLSGTAEIYRQRLPTGTPEQLTFDSTDDFSPAPSPDGREVAFHSWRSGSRDIYILPLNGGPVQAVTSSPAQESKPRWAPDGNAIAFTMYGGGIYVVRKRPNGTWGAPVERSSSGAWTAWSPDGRWIAYASYLLGGSLLITHPDSGAPRVLLDSAVSDGVRAEAPVWSGDSRTVYFKSHDLKGNSAFWSIPITGGRPTLLTRLDDPERPSYRPEWTMGPGRMYFTVDDRQSDVWVMEVVPR